ncbi:malate dehydrogenase, partial [Vibrio sp. 10N.261.45.A4]
GTEGIEEVLDYGVLSEFERASLDDMLETLSGDIAKGEEFAK